MSFDLNELRAQRDKVREHLNWLDRQIAQLEGKTPADQSPEPTTPEVQPPAQTKQAASETPAPAPAEIPVDYQPGGFDGSSKLGCILAGIVVAGLIIFLLFGLPELLYPDAP
ncbi:hypothetical protein [Cerasicoccus maritimus]|uniref:hypothetical protein n=1 Tax=Cerasicoccus maritimus TaxID=490089 RepID=UPI002852550C|nr:hypothetical protein [Cerasicoccus maritimus]